MLALGLGAAVFGAWRLASAPRTVLSPEREAMREALHHASVALPHLRRGLDERSAKKAAPHLRALSQASVVALASVDRVLAVDGPAAEQIASSAVLELARRAARMRIDVQPRAVSAPDLSGGMPAVIAPLLISGEPIGSLIALYEPTHRLRPDDARVVRELADLLSAQLELSRIATQEKRMVKAELDSLRARISPHFIYNSLAVIASYIRSRPEEARELLTEFAGFTRYAFREERAYVTVADELHYVQKYLRLEQARFGARLALRVEIDPAVLQAVVPVLSLQPLVENAVRHGVESQKARCAVEIVGTDHDVEVEIAVSDDGIGMDPAQTAAVLRGEARGIGIHNVDRRLRATFGDEYGLRIRSEPGHGTTVLVTVPKSHVGVRAA